MSAERAPPEPQPAVAITVEIRKILSQFEHLKILRHYLKNIFFQAALMRLYFTRCSAVCVAAGAWCRVKARRRTAVAGAERQRLRLRPSAASRDVGAACDAGN